MPQTYSDQEDRILQAIGAWQDHPAQPISQIARDFNVPYWSLYRRLHSVPSKIDQGGHNKKLTLASEQAVIQHIQLLEGFGIAPRPKFFRGIANSVLRTGHTDPSTPPPTVGINWPRNFIKRHPELHKQKQKPLAIERARSHDPEAIRRWFEDFRYNVRKYGVLEDDIYNMDETGYRIGCGRAHTIVTTKPQSRQYLPDPENRIHISSIECISAGGFVLPSTIILPGVQITHNFIVPELSGEILLAMSESGYSNDEIQMEWIKHFNKYTKTRTKGTKRLLLCDGYNSHLEYDFIEYCWDEGIIPYAFLPHTTHLAQPLDVKVFQPLKHYHSEAIDAAVRTGDTDFSKVEFLSAFAGFHRQAFKQSTIHSAFRETGIVPWNPEKVLSKIPRPSSPKATQEEDSFNFQETPKKPKDLIRYGRFISNLIEISDLPGNVHRSVNKFVKGALARNSSAALAEQFLEGTQLAEESRERRKKVARKQIQKGGVISINEARKQIRWSHNYNLDAIKARHKNIRQYHRKAQRRVNKDIEAFGEVSQWKRAIIHELW